MVVDTSALLSILLQEPDAARMSAALERADLRLISAVSVQEAGMVVWSRHGHAGMLDLERLLADAAIEIVPYDGAQARLAVEAFAKYGKGRHRAALNLGDCAAYALSKESGEPLLFKGDDFAKTDVGTSPA